MSFPANTVEARFAPLFEVKTDAANLLQKAEDGFGRKLLARALDDGQPIAARSEAAQTLKACLDHVQGEQPSGLHARYHGIADRREDLAARKIVARGMEQGFKDIAIDIWQSPLAARAAWHDLCHRVGSRNAAAKVVDNPRLLGKMAGRGRGPLADKARREAWSRVEDAVKAGRRDFVGSLLIERIEREDRRLATEQASPDFARMRAIDGALGRITPSDTMKIRNLTGQLLATQAQDWAVMRETRPVEAFVTAWRKANQGSTSNIGGLMDVAQTRWFMEAQSLARLINEDDDLRAAANRAGRGDAINHCLDPQNNEMPINLSLDGAGIGGPTSGGLIKP